MLLSEALDGFLLAKGLQCSPHTVRDYANTLRQWARFLVEDVHVEALTADDVRRFLYFLRVDRGLAPKTVKNAHTGLSAFFSFLESEIGIAHVMREKRVRAPRVQVSEVQPLSKQDVRQLLAACGRAAEWRTIRREAGAAMRPTRFRDRAIVLALLDTGMRAQELCDLVIGDVDRTTGAVQIRHGKGDKGRVVYLGQVARQALWRYLSRRTFREADDPLFATNKHGAMDRNALRKMLNRAGERAEIAERVGPHRLRHTFAINYLRNGGDVYTLQRLLGHTTMEMVRRYLALAQVDVAEAHRKASPADNWRLG